MGGGKTVHSPTAAIIMNQVHPPIILTGPQSAKKRFHKARSPLICDQNGQSQTQKQPDALEAKLPHHQVSQEEIQGNPGDGLGGLEYDGIQAFRMEAVQPQKQVLIP